MRKCCNRVDRWRSLACLVKDICQGLSQNLNDDSCHKAATIHLFWVPCAKGKPMVTLICEREETFGAGVTAPFVASLPAARSRAPTSLCRGGCDCRVWLPRASDRASSVFIRAAAVLWVPAQLLLSLMAEGGSKTLKEKDHCQGTLLEGDAV